MILTPIPSDRLPEMLRQFRDSLADAFAREILHRIAATSPDRALAAVAETHCQQALALAREFGMDVAEGHLSSGLSWDGERLYADTEAFVLVHEIAHFQLASPARRRLIDFGLGAGPDTVDRAAAERVAVLTELAGDREEAMVSLLGILREASLGHPALASFLDQNWLEAAGTERAAAHFSTVLRRLREGGFVDHAGRPTRQLRQHPDEAPELRVA
ncbi:MAG TPA: hypothetical protein VNW24_17010 [Stellaceae bacterium]|jgi:hypothetical protein|nr:hypothetical protein [Stellaceae bacterium]